MSVLIFLIPITLALGIAGLFFFMWTLKTKQYDDLEGAANRILFDDDKFSTTNDANKEDNKNKS